MAGETLLNISGQGVSPYSARGLTQTLVPIDAAKNLRRSINGALQDLSQAQFRKYASVISCSDQNAPAFESMPVGTQVDVECVATLSYKTAGGAPTRPVVTDSSRVDGAYTIYRPRLTMRVMDWNSQEDEYGATVAWQLTLEEI